MILIFLGKTSVSDQYSVSSSSQSYIAGQFPELFFCILFIWIIFSISLRVFLSRLSCFSWDLLSTGMSQLCSSCIQIGRISKIHLIDNKHIYYSHIVFCQEEMSSMILGSHISVIKSFFKILFLIFCSTDSMSYIQNKSFSLFLRRNYTGMKGENMRRLWGFWYHDWER